MYNSEVTKAIPLEARVMLPYLVIAKNHKQFNYWARENGWNEDIKNYVYASRIEVIRGKRYQDILKVGEWWEAPILDKYSLETLKAMLIKAT